MSDCRGFLRQKPDVGGKHPLALAARKVWGMLTDFFLFLFEPVLAGIFMIVCWRPLRAHRYRYGQLFSEKEDLLDDQRKSSRVKRKNKKQQA